MKLKLTGTHPLGKGYFYEVKFATEEERKEFLKFHKDNGVEPWKDPRNGDKLGYFTNKLIGQQTECEIVLGSEGGVFINPVVDIQTIQKIADETAGVSGLRDADLKRLVYINLAKVEI